MPKILIVEDDQRIAKLLKQFLTMEKFQVETKVSGEEALEHLTVFTPDLVILDLMLPGMDGIEFCLQFRQSHQQPILMLTAQEGDIQEVTALNAGIDDFLAKPIRTHVLLARINALLRRSQNQTKIEDIQLANLCIDREARKVTYNASQLNISDSEFELLWYLASRAGDVVTRDELFKHIRGREYDGLDRSIDMRVSKLRKSLAEQTEGKDYIRTIRQQGYVFVGD